MNRSPAFDRVESIFHAALDCSQAGARERYLAEACRGEPALEAEVRRFLAADSGAADGFLSPPDFALPARWEQDVQIFSQPEEQPTEELGNYRLIEELGRGGFGVVWRARQEQPVRREVALKVIKLGMDTREVIARFEQERQALAMMDHPGIAKVLDAGATATGRPFFVMEVVSGTRITEFCDARQLTIRERLALFCQVCEAVQHAHQKGIIHRDLKPSNILVAEQDGRSAPKVIDFGIAKAITQKLTDETLCTDPGQRIGTPVYMSPEQAESGGLNLDTRSDLYSLGVLLCELLTGQTPFARKTARAEVGEIGVAGWEQDARRPSARLRVLAEADLAKAAAARQCEPSTLIRLIKGDLDWIVVKAVERDRERRYETAAALAGDIQRHLACEPVKARPPSRLYRFRRLVRRNRGAFAAAAAVLVAMVAGTVMSVWHAVRAEAALDELRATAPAFAEQARSLVIAERFGEAIEKLDYAMKLRPSSAEYVVAKANLFQSQLQFAPAAQLYRAALRLSPGDPGAAANLQLCEELLAAPKASGNTPIPRESLARLYSAMQRESRPAAELMPLARLLGEENKLLLAQWTARLSHLPIGAERPLSERLKLRDDGLLALDLSGTQVADLTALEGMPLGELDCTGCRFVSELTFTRGLPLRCLLLGGTSVSQLSAVATLSALEELRLEDTKVASLDALRGLRLKVLHLDRLQIQDLHALAGMPLEDLRMNSTLVLDLSPLTGLALRRLEMDDVPATNYTPLADLPLEFLSMGGLKLRDLNFARRMPLKQLFLGTWPAHSLAGLEDLGSLEVLILPETYCPPTDPRFSQLTALRQHPLLRQLGMSASRVRDLDTLVPPQQFWPDWLRRNEVVAGFLSIAPDMSVTLTVQADRTWDVSAIKARNAGGHPVPSLAFLQGAPISKLTMRSLHIKDLAPLASMSLRFLDLCNCSVEDISVLRGMAIEELNLATTQVTDLSPLRGMPLKGLCIDGAPVSDLSPLRGMLLERLWTGTTNVSDLSPIRGMPLRLLHIDGCPFLTDVSPVADLPLLEQVWLPKSATNTDRLRSLKKLKYISFEFDGAAQRPKHTAAEFFSIEQPKDERTLASEKRFAELERLIRSRLNNRTSTEEWKDYLKLGPVTLAQGNHAGYRQACAEMLQRLQTGEAWVTVYVAALAPDSGISASHLRLLMNAVSGQHGEKSPTTLFVNALAAFRLGEISRAERHLGDLLSWKGGSQFKVSGRALLSLIRGQQGDPLAAAGELFQAQRALDDERRTGGSHFWNDWLMVELLVKEAEERLASATKPVELSNRQ